MYIVGRWPTFPYDTLYGHLFLLIFWGKKGNAN
jgi:hypothetical protein